MKKYYSIEKLVAFLKQYPPGVEVCIKIPITGTKSAYILNIEDIEDGVIGENEDGIVLIVTEDVPSSK